MLAGACAASHGSPCPDLDRVTAFEDDLRRVTCAFTTRCYQDGNWWAFYYDYCSPLPDRWTDELCSALADGSASFRPAAADACLTQLHAWAGGACTQPSDPWFRYEINSPPAVCEDAFSWTTSYPPPILEGDCLADGHGCPDDFLCVAGDTCGGRCEPLRREGEPCGTLGCANGLWCDYVHGRVCRTGCPGTGWCPMGTYCVDHACTVTTLPRIGERCDYDLPCADAGSYCNVRTGLCTPQTRPGEACDPEGGDLACAAGTCDASGACVGTSCYPSRTHDDCLPSAPYCGPEGQCTADPASATCSYTTSTDPTACPSGTVCDLRLLDREPYYPCRPRADIGATCDDSVVCADGSTCWRGRCTRIAGFEEACSELVPCPSGLTCRGGTCAYPTQQIGEPCDAAHACSAGTCRDGRCGWLASGEACTASEECRLYCRRGACTETTTVGVGQPCGGYRICEEPLSCVVVNLDDPLADWLCRAPCPSP